MKRIMLFASLLLVSVAAKAQLFINEISQGASGDKDYIELVVAGTRTCTDSTMDLRGIIVDDNAGWYGTGSFNAGCFRFANNSNWSAVPYGSIILVYNSDDKNPAITLTDDPTDANHDYVYVVADTSLYLELNAEPAAMSSSFDYSTAAPGSWLPFAAGSFTGKLALDDSTDVVSIINPSVSTTSATHSVSWGWLSAGGTQTAAIQLAGNSAGGFNLYHTGNSPATQNLWTIGVAASADETPGVGNTKANSDWIDSMRAQMSAPEAPGNISGPATLCTGTTATYAIASVAGATSYTWNTPGGWTGTSTDTGIMITVMSTGAITVEAVNACGSSAVTTFSVNALTPPPTPTAIVGSGALCAGSTETYSIPSAGSSTLAWTLPSGWSGVISGNDISCTAGSIGGTISAVVTDVCGTTTLTLPVTVKAWVSPSVSLSASGTTVCSGALVMLMAIPVNGGVAPSYQWRLNGAPLAVSGPGFTTTTLQNGDSVSVILNSSELCLTTNNVPSNQVTMQVLPFVVPGILVSAFPSTTVCQGNTVTFSSTVTNAGSSPSYQWYQNGLAIPGAQASKYSTSKLNNGDTIYAAVISSAVCPSKDTMPGNPVTVTVNPIVNPVVSISASHTMPVPQGTTVTFTASYSGGGTTPGFQWLKNGKPVPSETAAVFTTSNLKQNDTISLRMTSHDPCPVNAVVTSNQIRVSNSATTGIDVAGANDDVKLSLYPNPNNGQFILSVDWNSGYIGDHVAIDVLNIMGQLVYHKELQATTAHSDINISLGEGIAKGMYQLRMSSSKVQANRQLLIQQ